MNSRRRRMWPGRVAAAREAGGLLPSRRRRPVAAGRAALSYPGKLAALEAAHGSFEAAHDAIARRCGPVISKRQAEESVVRSAADIPAFYAARIPEPCTLSALLVLSADCKGIVMRPGALRAATAKAAVKLGKMRTRLTAREKPNHRRRHDPRRHSSRRSGADACIRYLGSKREFLRYDQALDAGWPIATGVIEGHAVTS
jgi:hypothetical protein